LRLEIVRRDSLTLLQKESAERLGCGRRFAEWFDLVSKGRTVRAFLA